MTACISRTFMWHNRWDADHCPCVECEPNWAPQPELDASVKRVTSVSLAARGRPCRTAGDDHHATSDRTHCGTWIRSDQFPVLWHHAVAAHHWTGRRRSRPRRTSEAMNTNMLRSLCSRASKNYFRPPYFFSKQNQPPFYSWHNHDFHINTYIHFINIVKQIHKMSGKYLKKNKN